MITLNQQKQLRERGEWQTTIKGPGEFSDRQCPVIFNDIVEAYDTFTNLKGCVPWKIEEFIGKKRYKQVMDKFTDTDLPPYKIFWPAAREALAALETEINQILIEVRPD